MKKEQAVVTDFDIKEGDYIEPYEMQEITE